MTPDLLAQLIGDPPAGPTARPRAGWLAIGETATRTLGRWEGSNGTPPGSVEAGVSAQLDPVLSVDNVHAGLATLARGRRDGCLVSARALRDRPRAALRSLRRALAGATLLVLGDDDRERVLAAARALDVPVLSHDAPPHDVPRSGPALPRADQGQPAAPPLDVGRFAEGCLDRIPRPRALTRYIVRALVEASGASRASVLLREPGRRTSLRLHAARGWDASFIGKVRCSVGAGIAGRVAAIGRPVAGRGSKGGPRGYAGAAYVVLPLGRGTRCEGVVNLTGLPADALPEPDSLRAWARLARRAGVALGHARRLRRAERLSARDALTGLPNRRAFERALARELERARRGGTGLVVGLVDVDHFKDFNDRFGHQAGDRVLVEIGRRLRDAFRETDLVCRWGGEEFAVLLPGPAAGSAQEALVGLERARLGVSGRPLDLGPGLPASRVTVSGGLAAFPPTRPEAEALIRAADQALYAAKEAGRDCIRGA